MTKILLSEGFGAGWSTWEVCSDRQKEVAEYQPIIEFLEAGGDSCELIGTNDEKHPLVRKMMADLDLDYFYTGGADGLVVREVKGRYFIVEYDGSESVITEESCPWW